MSDIQFHVTASVEIFPDVIDRLLDSPDGPVGILVKGAADEVLKFAKLNIGDTFGGHHPGPRLADTGRVEPLGGAAYAVVFSKTLPSGHDLAVLHHEGASPHPIGEPGKILVRKAPPPNRLRFQRQRVLPSRCCQPPWHAGQSLPPGRR